MFNMYKIGNECTEKIEPVIQRFQNWTPNILKEKESHTITSKQKLFLGCVENEKKTIAVRRPEAYWISKY